MYGGLKKNDTRAESFQVSIQKNTIFSGSDYDVNFNSFSYIYFYMIGAEMVRPGLRR